MARHGRYVMVGHPQHIIVRNQTTLTPLITPLIKVLE